MRLDKKESARHEDFILPTSYKGNFFLPLQVYVIGQIFRRSGLYRGFGTNPGSNIRSIGLGILLSLMSICKISNGTVI